MSAIGQGGRRNILSLPLAGSVLAHLAALALALVLVRPQAVLPPESLMPLTIDLSCLELASEGGGGGSLPQAAPAPAPRPAAARHQAVPASRTPAQQAITPAASAAPATQPPAAALSAPAREEAPQAPSAASATGPASGQASASAPGGSAAAVPALLGPPGSGGAVSGVGTGSGAPGGHGRGLGPGLGEGLSGIPKDYLTALHREIERHKTYPAQARRRGLEGEVRVGFVVECDGSISRVEVVGSSGSNLLDEAAAATLQQIRRLPPLPDSLRLARLRLELPMVFRLTR